MSAWPLPETFAPELAAVLLDSALKGAVLLGVILLALRGMKKRSAAARHLALSLAFGSLVFLPLLSWTLPRLAVLPVWTRVSLQAAARPVAPGGKNPALPWDTAVPGGMAGLGEMERAHGNPSVRPAGNRELSTDGMGSWSVMRWALALWLLGAGLVLAPALAGALSLKRLQARARIVDSGPLAELTGQLAAAMKVRRRFLLLSAAARSMPMTWGLRQPKILLPHEAAQWPPERQRLVLVHEMAHVARGDFSSTLLARLACALYWFNPLVWMAARQARHEQEQACDDLVLSHGAQPARYAREVLEFAAGHRVAVLESFGALAMARPSRLEGRLLAILDSTRNRGCPSLPLIRSAALLTLLALIPLAMLGAAAQIATPARETSEPGLVAWWRAENNTEDSAGTHPGEGPFGVEYMAEGIVGKSFDFRRTYAIEDLLQRVTVADSPDFALSEEFTLEAWIYPRLPGGIVLLRGDDRAGFDTWQIDLMAMGAIDFHFNSADNQSAGIRAPIELHQWQHVAVTFHQGSMKFYINGVLLTQGETKLRPIANLDARYNPSLGIGNAGGKLYNMPFDGMIDEVRIYKRALSAEDIRQDLKR